MSVITYLEAIRQALFEEMDADPRVFVLGEDVGAYGGAFKVTAGLQEKFGEERVIDTPISESAIVGAAIGAALSGLRPVAEMQFINSDCNSRSIRRWRSCRSISFAMRGIIFSEHSRT
jgi:pyruvate/2-oxoglutarate/acetoin dehydrogenase E1 component